MNMTTLNTPLPEDLMKLKWNGQFKLMQEMIDLRLQKDIPTKLKERLELEKELISRLPEDFTYSKEDAIALLKSNIQAFKDEEFDELFKDNAFEWIFIEGKLYLKDNFFENLIKVRKAYKDRLIEKDGAASTLLDDVMHKMKEEKDFYTISESLDIPYESVFDELAHMQECNPFPCSEYDTESTTNLALPEFTIEIDEDQLRIIPKEMGNLTIHSEEVKLSKEAKKYLNEAKFYIDSINRRNKTILLLANILITHQKNYFLFQDDLKECTLKEIAQESGYSISTVSRTLSDKYYEFNGHMYPVKDLFISKTHKGSSKDSIQKAIQLLIEVENPENPLQDEEIVEELENMELYASRRTISKYRKELNIPNSKQRKKAGLY